MSTTRATQGDAQALLRAFGNGGWAVINHSRVERARHGPGDTAIHIRPLDAFDGRHYCVLDWHTIVIADVEGGNQPYPRQEAEATIADTRVELTLDGAPLATTQTPVAAFLNPGWFGLEDAFYSQWGRVMAPADLAVGQHTLSLRMTSASRSWRDFRNTITFFIDADGTGACR